MRTKLASPERSREHADRLIAWLRQAAERIDSRHIDESGAIPLAVHRDFASAGLFGMYVPEEFGGLALRSQDIIRVLEQVAAIDLTLVFIVGFSVLCAHGIVHHAREPLRAAILPALASGRASAVTAMTEPGVSGSDPLRMQATATPDGPDRWRISGTKFWIPAAAWASVILVFVRQLDENGKSLGLSGFCVDKDAPGLDIGPRLMNMGLKGFSFYQLTFNDVPVTIDDQLGAPGKGMDTAQSSMQYIRVSLAGMCLGATRRCAQLMYNYASRRRIASGRLLKNPVIARDLDDLTARLTAIQTCVYRTAALLDDGAEIPDEVCIACKNEAAELLGEAADRAIQTMGARGYSEANLAAKILRDARGLRILEGPTEALQMFVGARVVAGSAPLHTFLGDALGLPDLATELREHARAVVEFVTGEQAHLFADSASAHYFACDRVGALTSRMILLATLRASLRGRAAEPAEKRALRWLGESIKLILSGVLNSTWEQPDIDYFGQVIAGYRTVIGDIKPFAHKERPALDPLLCDGAE